MQDLLHFQIARMTNEAVSERLRSVSPVHSDTVQEAYQICVRWPAELRQSYKEIWDLVITSRTEPRETYRTEWLKVLDEALGVMHALADLLGNPLSPIRRSQDGRLTVAIASIQSFRQEVEESGPWFSDRDQPGAPEEHDRGDALPLDEAFADVAGVSVADWRERVRRRQETREAK